MTRFYSHTRIRVVSTASLSISNYKNNMILRCLPIAAVLVFTIVGIGLISNTQLHDSRYWPGWYLLRVPGGIDETAAIKALRSSGVDDAVSPSTATVRYMGIPELVTTTVDRIEEELLPGDPRRDPFLQNVDRLFRAGDSYIIFLPGDRSLSSYRRIINRSEIFENAVLPDDMRRSRLITILFFLLALGGMAFLLPGHSPAILASSPPWVFTVIVLGFPMGFFCLALCVFTVCRHISRRWPLAVSLVGSLLVLFAASRQLPPQNTLILVIAALGSEAAYYGVHRSRPSPPRPALRRKRRDHRLFEPLFLTNRSTSALPKPVLMSFVRYGLVLGAILPFAFFGDETTNHNPLPAVGAPLGGYDSLSAFHALNALDSVDTLPDVSDLIASAAFQENFLNGAQFKLPLPGTVLKKYQYRQSGDEIDTVQIPIAAYDAEWYEQTRIEALAEGVGLLFSSLDGPSPVMRVTQPLYGNTAEAPSFLSCILAAILLLFSLTLSAFSTEWGAMVRNRSSANGHKKVQAA